MEESPEDLPKPPRRTAARPFFSPRPSGEGVTGPLELKSRRAAQLFTPPGSSSATPPAHQTTAPATADDREVEPRAADDAGRTAAEMPEVDDEGSADAGEGWAPAPTNVTGHTLDAESLLAQRNGVDDDDRLVVEQFEHEEIELTGASATTVPDEHLIEVIGYDDANTLLKAAAIEGERPEVDGLRIETTEFSFQDAAAPRLNVESFWATEPFGAEERAVEGAEMALDNAEIAPDVEEHPLEALKESEPWSVSPGIDESNAQWSSSFDESAHEEAAPVEAAEVETALAELVVAEHAVEAPAKHDVADALERIAARVRGGEIDVPSGSESSDAAALSAVLTALLRQSH
jgi:hypothetical protein